MKLFLLRPVEGLPKGDNPWDPWYDKAFGFVIRAETEARAREFAHEQSGDEVDTMFLGRKVSDTNTPWLNSKYSTCVELSPEGNEEVIIRDFASA